MTIKWTKDDVIKRFQETMVPTQGKAGPEVLKGLLEKAKRKPVEGQLVRESEGE